ncbi:MAG: GtrA family protein [Pseudomonadota bacterium]
MRQVAGEFSRFLTSGLVATACHYALLIALVETKVTGPVLATALGAVLGAAVSYALNRRFTFRSSRAHTEALPRFLIIAAAAVLLNAALMALFTNVLSLPYLYAQILATALITLLTYGGNRLWTFRAPSGRDL